MSEELTGGMSGEMTGRMSEELIGGMSGGDDWVGNVWGDDRENV